MKKLWVCTYGCQMNVRDSEEVTGLLLERGYALSESEEAADVILYNTCSVREQAENRVWSNVSRLRQIKAQRPELVVGVMGCMAKAQKGNIFKRMPHVDFISGPSQLYEVPELIDAVYKSREPAGEGGCGAVERASPLAAIQLKRRAEFRAVSYHAGQVTAFITIMEGCDKVCSYCVIPYTRGPEVSRPPDQVLAEVERLAGEGYKEVMLLGQNVNSYGKRLAGDSSVLRQAQHERERVTFADLLRRVDAVPGLKRIRFITSHPWDAAEELFAAMAELDSVCEHLHLPVQSGSDRVLERMRRGYTGSEYLRKLEALRALVPEVAVTTDLIVGFPGETEEDFEKTRQLVEEARFDSAFIFAYSPRPYAAASRWEDDVPEEVKDRRLQTLLALQERITREESQKKVGSTVEVLVEEPGMGRTRGNRKVYFAKDSSSPGDLVEVKVESVRGQSFVGSRTVRPSTSSGRTAAAMLLAAIFGFPAAASAADLSSIQGAFLRGEYETVVRETAGEPGRGAAAQELLYLRGIAALKLRDWELARGSLTRLLEEYAAGRWAPHAWLALGDSWMEAGQPVKAGEVYEKALKEGRMGELKSQALLRLGNVQRELGLWKEARDTFAQVTQAAPDSPEAGSAKEILGREDFFFTVQVGSFVTRNNAERLAHELQKRGYRAEVSEAVMGGKQFHRVRVGRFSSRSEAETEARRLSGDGFPARIFP